MIRRLVAPALALVALTACPALDPLQRQQKVKSYQENDFFDDRLAMRHPPAGTVPHRAPVDPVVA